MNNIILFSGKMGRVGFFYEVLTFLVRFFVKKKMNNTNYET